jgi:YHS domain-containing protein
MDVMAGAPRRAYSTVMTRRPSVAMVSATSAVVAVLLLGLAPVACGPSATPAAKSGTAASDLKAPGDAKVGDKTKCPVSGEEFTVTASSPKVEHKGKTYFFCCPGCDDRFRKNPEKYIGGGGT